MEVRTYEALTMKDAIKAVKRELGDDAVILSIRNKSIPGSDNSKTVEVRAAAASSRVGGSAVSSHENASSMMGTLSVGLQTIESKISKVGDVAAKRDQVDAIDSGIKELKSLLLQSLRVHDLSLCKNLPAEFAALEEQLRLSGISPKIIVDLINHLRSAAEKQTLRHSDQAPNALQAAAVRWLMKRMTVAPRWIEQPGTAAFHCIVGAPGVGKTSIAAKLASQLSQREKSRVHLMSLDHSRLGASDQMRILAKVLDVDFRLIDGANEIRDVIRKNESGIFIIDSPGISSHNRNALQPLAILASSTLPIEFHLALSTAEKPEICDRQISFFSELGIKSVIFTNLDESNAYGDIVNTCIKWSLPMSYFSNGQRIPEDIERASRERVIERVLRI
jgi:flagellar biosynthesis protein FlhF